MCKADPCAMPQLLKVIHIGQHRQDRFHDHAHIPGFALADFQIGRITPLGMKAWVAEAEEDRLVLNIRDQRLKGIIRDMCRRIVLGCQVRSDLVSFDLFGDPVVSGLGRSQPHVQQIQLAAPVHLSLHTFQAVHTPSVVGLDSIV